MTFIVHVLLYTYVTLNAANADLLREIEPEVPPFSWAEFCFLFWSFGSAFDQRRVSAYRVAEGLPEGDVFDRLVVFADVMLLIAQTLRILSFVDVPSYFDLSSVENIFGKMMTHNRQIAYIGYQTLLSCDGIFLCVRTLRIVSVAVSAVAFLVRLRAPLA